MRFANALTSADQPMDNLVLHPSQTIYYQLTHSGGIEVLVDLSGKSEQGTWNRVHATACAYEAR